MPAKKPSQAKQPFTVASLGEVAQVCGVNRDTVNRWRSEGMPGKPRAWDIAAIIKWLRTEGPWKPKHQLPASEDPLLDDGDSPALERYRLAKAKHAELDLEYRKGELIDKEKARDILARWAVLIRRMGERLGKKYGNEAALAVNDTLTECGSIVEELSSNDS